MTQLGLFEGQKRRDEGIAKRLSNENSFIVDLLKIQAKHLSRLNGSVCSDDLRKYADSQGLHMNHANSWGAAMRTIFSQDGWQHIGWKESEIESNHARCIRIWKWTR